MRGPAPAASAGPSASAAAHAALVALAVVVAAAAAHAGPPLAPAHALDDPGLRQSVSVRTDGYDFVVDVTSTFAVAGHEFSADERRLTLFAEGAASENLAEIVIPSDLIGGNLTFYVDGSEVPARVVAGSDAAFATVRFSGPGSGSGAGGGGSHTLDIVGTTYLPEFGAASVAVLAAAAAAAAVASRRAGGGGASFRAA